MQASAAKAAQMASKTTAAINNIEISTKILLEAHKYLGFIALYRMNFSKTLQHNLCINNPIVWVNTIIHKNILKCNAGYGMGLKV